MERFEVKQSDLIGEIKDFPIEIVQEMVQQQIKQNNIPDPASFQECAYCGLHFEGFSWEDSSEGFEFWKEVIHKKNFDLYFKKYPKTMEETSIKINVPDGYEIDEANSSFTEIKFKLIEIKYPKSWNLESSNNDIRGFWINNDSEILRANGFWSNRSINVFKTEKQAKAMLAYAQITQLMALPCYNGDWEPDCEDNTIKFILKRYKNTIELDYSVNIHYPIAFKSKEVGGAFRNNHVDLLRTYFEI